ncbi:MAG: efflux RND transporter periplasmic adaptor subunit [Rhodospirillales bacterium]|nr:efflux RND transporter periplasmic adaptor subunit [Rhodospirillales bacterium]
MKRLIWLAVALLIASGAYYGISARHAADAAKNKPPESRPQVVVLGKATRQAMPIRLSAIGTVQPLATVAVKARLEGQVAAIHFTEGQDVKAGDLLFSLDRRQTEAQLRQAEASLARDQAQLEKAKNDFTRYEQLIKDQAVSQQKYEDARAALGTLNATVRAGQAAVENSRLMDSYTRIHAPFAGRTGQAIANVGSIVKPGDNAAMVTITQTRPIQVQFGVPERELPAVRRAMAEGAVAVQAQSQDESLPAVQGRLVFIDSAIDPATGTIQLKAQFANEDMALWPGQFVAVSMTLRTDPNALVVPTAAIQNGQEGAYLFVVDAESTARIRPIKVGPAAEGKSTILSGVAEGETVVIDGQIRIANGVKVTERRGPPPPDAKAEAKTAGTPNGKPTP